MATDVRLIDGFANHDATEFSIWNGVKRVLEPVASLKLTVALFALSIFLILAGTFAQVDKDIWEVIGLYFRVWIAWVPFQVFFPPSFFPEKPWDISGGIWFPGGKMLGLMMAMNLVAAHLVRFKAAAKGARLWIGFVAIGLGCLVTWAIVVAGGNSKGIQADPWLSYSTQWTVYQGLLGLAAVAAAIAFVNSCHQPLLGKDEQWSLQRVLKGALKVSLLGMTGFSLAGMFIFFYKPPEKWVRLLFFRGLLAATAILFATLCTRMLLLGEAGRPSDSSMRILWQLAQGTVASIALLGGCWTVFGKRAGIVLLHGGIGLMMFYELHVALTAVETQMNLVEGEQTNFVQDIRTNEFAITDITDPKEDHVVAVPKSIALAQGLIDHPDLPFKIRIDPKNFVQNAKLRAASPRDNNPATTGIGLIWFPEPVKPGAGADSDSKVDTPTAYVTLESKADQKPLGTYLVGLEISAIDEADTVRVGAKSYKIELRPKRYYKTYRFELKDVKREDYLGTSTPRNYASTVHIVDSARSVNEEKTIWMNNPLRFANETFYQSSYYQEPGTGVEHTTLSVVANSGWMMPYVGCMLVGVGMLFHFLNLLIRFLTKSDAAELSTEESDRAAKLAAKLGIKPRPAAESLSDSPQWRSASFLRENLFAAAMVIFAVSYIAGNSVAPRPKSLSFDFYRFGQIPVVSEGRTKPLGSAAASSLLAISGRTKVIVGEKKSRFQKILEQLKIRPVQELSKPYEEIPAIEWLAEVITESKVADDREIFRIENLELQETIGVKKREGMRYSRNDIQARFKEFGEQVRLASEQAMRDRKQLSVYKKKVLELAEKVSTYDNLKYAFGLHYRIGGEKREEIIQSIQLANEKSRELEEERQPIFAVGPLNKDEKWHILSRAYLLDLVNIFQKNGKENKFVTAWDKILRGYSDNKPAPFNNGVDDLLKLVDDQPPRDVTPWVIRLESYFNHVQPFTIAIVLYLIAFILGALGWLAWPRGFNRAAFCLLLVTLVLHTIALLARLVISGRPPVTNLYSSAVFIGWGCVLLGLLFEVIYRIGIGNLVAAVAGYATLLIADVLSSDGDTFTVLQAVLDTQFWLATHVTCITLGYATTYLAGLFGVAYIMRGVCTPSLTLAEGRDIHRMIYGTLCFSILFSFVGTVLGGLWADDSWGRFWGWDPKENAALIIVLWNALALHARWGGMVKERGLAALAVGGNIFVSWSWWGVNALGAGLHSYGFKQGTLRNLGIFIAVNLVIIGIGLLPDVCWWSLRRRARVKSTV